MLVPVCFAFSFHQSGRSLEKSSKGVSFPLCLNLAAYSAAPIPASQEGSCVPGRDGNAEEQRVPDCWYHLYGIVSHGGGMGGGEPFSKIASSTVASKELTLTLILSLFALGHYVAYVRKENVAAACAHDSEPSSHSRTPCQLDQSKLTSDWFYISDSDCRPVSVAEVLRVQAYILFYAKA